MLRKKGFRDQPEVVQVTFVLPGDQPQAQAGACVVGDFNDWDPEATPLQKRSNQTYSASVLLTKGQSYAYRYRTLAGEWFDVGDAEAYQPNEFGGQNGLFTA